MSGSSSLSIRYHVRGFKYMKISDNLTGDVIFNSRNRGYIFDDEQLSIVKADGDRILAVEKKGKERSVVSAVEEESHLTNNIAFDMITLTKDKDYTQEETRELLLKIMSSRDVLDSEKRKIQKVVDKYRKYQHIVPHHA